MKRKGFYLTTAILLFIAGLAGAIYFWGENQFQLGEEAMRHYQFEEAIVYFKKAQRSPFTPADIHRKLARAYRMNGQIPEAKEEIEKGKKVFGPADEKLQLESILIRAIQGELNDVLAGLWTCIHHNDPETVPIFDTMVDAYIQMKDFNHAFLVLETWKARAPNSPYYFFREGVVFENMQQSIQALNDFEEALTLDPDFLPARTEAIQIAFEQKKIETVKKLIPYLETNFANRKETIFAQAKIYLMEGDEEKCRSKLKMLENIDADYIPMIILRGELEYSSSNFSEAIRWLTLSNEKIPGIIHTHYLLGLCYREIPGEEKKADYHTNRYEELKKLYYRIGDLVAHQLSRNPNNIELIEQAVTDYFAAEQYDDALAWGSRGLLLDPGNRTIRKAFANYYHQKNDPILEKYHIDQIDNKRSQKSIKDNLNK